MLRVLDQRSELALLRHDYMKKPDVNVRVADDTDGEALQAIESCLVGVKRERARAGDAGEIPKIGEVIEQCEQLVATDGRVHIANLTVSVNKILDASYDGEASGEKLRSVLGGAPDGKIWSEELDDKASYKDQLAKWMETGCIYNPTKLQTKQGELKTAVGNITTMVQKLGLKAVTPADEEAFEAKEAAKCVQRVSTTIAEGLVFYHVEKTTPLRNAKLALGKKTAAWASQQVQMHPAVKATMDKVLLLRKP